MENTTELLRKKIRMGALMLAAGVLVFITGLSLPYLLPASVLNLKWLEAIGLLLIVWGGVMLARYVLARRRPGEMRRSLVEERDERTVAIRNQAGYTAYLVSMVITSLGLFIYSSLNQTPGFDPIWLLLAFLVLAPTAVFISYLVWLNSHY